MADVKMVMQSPYVMSLDVNEYGIRTIYTNITDRCHLNTLRGYTLVDN